MPDPFASPVILHTEQPLLLQETVTMTYFSQGNLTASQATAMTMAILCLPLSLPHTMGQTPQSQTQMVRRRA